MLQINYGIWLSYIVLNVIQYTAQLYYSAVIQKDYLQVYSLHSNHFERIAVAGCKYDVCSVWCSVVNHG